MPETCGTWPAFWTTAATDNWPQEGEIDIFEQANNANSNQISLHISSQQGECLIERNPNMSATPDRFAECSEEASGGCDTNDPRTNSFGSSFNANGGGVYAMEWITLSIKIWFFPRDSIPSGEEGPLGSSPTPSTWGLPTTVFQSRDGTGCDMGTHVKNQRIIIDTTFCGTWAGETWESSGCKGATGYETCEGYVRDRPDDFRRAFWTFRGLRVYV